MALPSLRGPNDAAARIEAAKRLNGSIVVGLGPSGCGKTDTIIPLSLAAAFLNGVDWYGYDANGDVKRTFMGVYRHHQQAWRTANSHEARDAHGRKLAFLDRCLRFGFFSGAKKLPSLQANVLRWVQEGIVESERNPNASVRAILCIDEAGSVRDEDDTFWPSMRMARNAGLTIYTTGHRLKDWHPAARANLRVGIIWKPLAEKFVEFNGNRIPRVSCGEHKSDRIHYFVGEDPAARVWDRAKYPSLYPPELVVPAQPTKARDRGF